MGILWITLFLVFLLAFYSRFLAKPVSNGFITFQPNRFMMLLAMLLMAVVSGLRNNIGDTFFYMYSYNNFPLEWSDIKFEADFGFNLMQLLLQKISEDAQLLIFTVALITNVFIIYVLYKYSNLFELSLYLYFTTGLYLMSMNGIRQFLAAALAFAATKFIFEGSWHKYILVILLAATIHQSALVLIPIYFIVRRKAWTYQTFILLSLAIIFVIGFAQFSGALFTVIKDTKYSEYQNLETNGANFLRVIVTAVPLVIAFLGRHRLRELFPKADYIVNLSLINVVIMLIATQQWVFARFSFYFGLYNLLLIPWIVKLFVRKEQRLIYYLIVLFYFVYCYYENVVSLNIIYKSDFLKF
ncbi:EpsG family protein [Paenibacillus aurantius]|uniref:EpsG family protein n=1 Tax=Paenibacillus aurantius TaxID=2918900 RepID=A0AA96RGN8_9BACL|nr:EpsG family protein [Paenibacillus aurantius]WNQ12701.1 EpsG family protein [Paenibacillus aurantius]